MNAPVRAPLVGEVLDARDVVEVVVQLNMFEPGSVIARVPAGSTIAECVVAARAVYRGPKPGQVTVALGDQLIKAEWWQRVRVKPGAFIAVRGVPGKDSGLIGNILRLAVAVAAIGVTLIPGLNVVAAAALAAGITLGGQYLVGKLFPLRPPVLKAQRSSDKSRAYSISGGSNSADPYGPIPFILGTHRTFPKLAAGYYTEFKSGDQFLHGLYVVGYGRLAVTSIKIGETPIADFDDVSYEVREGIESDAAITLYPHEVVEDQLSIELTHDIFFQNRTTATGVDEIQLDIAWPGGLYHIETDDGTYSARDASIRAEFRGVGTTAWQLLGTLSITGKSPDPIRKTIAKKMTSAGQWEVKVKKASPDTDTPERNIEQVFWTALRGIRHAAPINFGKPLSLIALRIRASAQLNGAVDDLNCVASSYAPIYNGSSWVSGQTTRNPAFLFRYALQGPFNPRPVADEAVDLGTLAAWGSFCATKGFTFDMVRDFRAKVWDLLADICAAGRAFPCFKDGKWSVVWEDPSAPIVGHYTPRNSRGFTGNRDYVRAPHAFRVRFVNAAVGYKADEITVYDDGYDASNATLFEVIEFPGITSSTVAHKFGRYHIAQARLRPETYSLIVAREHFRNTVGDRVYVQHYLPLFGLTAGRVKGVDGTTITIDEPVIMESGKDYGIRFQLADGTTLLRTVTNDPGQQTELELSGGGMEVGDLFMFGIAGEEAVVLRIKNIAHLDEAEARLTLVDDAPGIADTDDGEIPAYDSHITIPADPFTLAPFSLAALEQTRIAGSVAFTDVLVTWDMVAGSGAVSFEVWFRDDITIQFKNGIAIDDGIWVVAGRVDAPAKFLLVQSRNLGIGKWSFRVRAQFADGKSTKWIVLAGVNLAGGPAQPADVTDFRIASITNDLASLSWSPVTTSGISHYVIRYSTALTGALWSAATIILDRVDATFVQVQALPGTYLIKAVNLVGAESLNAVTIETSIAALNKLNVVETYQADPDWDGTLTHCEVEDEALQLVEVGGILDWPPVLDLPSGIWTTQFPWAYGLFEAADVIDLGEVFTSRVSVLIDAVGENVSNIIGAWGPLGTLGLIAGNADGWSVRLQSRTTLDDPVGSPIWTDYSELVASSDITARAFGPFRLYLYSLNPGIRPVVSSLKVTIDMPDRLESGNDLVCTTGGLHVTYSAPFRNTPQIAIAMQSIAAGDTAREIITNKTSAGFDILFKNASGAAVQVVFDYVAKGYGRKVAA